VKFSLRAKTVLLLSALTLGPVAGTVVLLVTGMQQPVLDAEQQLQSAVVRELADETSSRLLGVENDAVAVAAVFSHAAEGKIRDEDAIESVRALIGSRENLNAIRFEVPAAKVSTMIRWSTTAEEVPESTPELRAIADADTIALSTAGASRGLLVVRIRSAEGAKAPPGYVTMRADVDGLRATVEDIARSHFGGDASVLLATADHHAIAAFGVPHADPGESVADLPIWRALPTNAQPRKPFSVVFEFTDGGTPMVGAVFTIPTQGWWVASFRPKAVAYKSLYDMRRNGALATAVAVILAILAGLLAAGGLTAPILAIVGQARLIARRRWREVSLASTRTDEIGELTRSLGEMARDLEQGEKEAKLRADLSRFMSKQLVDAIVKGEHPLALGGKRAVVSVVFADVVGFTPLAEARDAEQIVALLNELFSVLTEIVFRHGGTVDKFVGDCIMAVWGAPVAQEDHAARALGAAEDMMRFLETANEGWRDKYDLEIRLGIGVNSGEALVGNIGSDKRMEYTVIGDVVNVAARLEAIAQPNQVLVAASTRDLVGDAFVLNKLGDRRLTGRKTETTVYALDVD
jgi:adenylate cyclase